MAKPPRSLLLPPTAPPPRPGSPLARTRGEAAAVGGAAAARQDGWLAGEMRGRAAAAREIRQAYLAYYRANWAQGKLEVCDEPEVKRQVRRLLLPPLPAEPGAAEGPPPRPGQLFDVHALAGSCLLAMKRSPGAGGSAAAAALGRLSRALEFLELLCVHLFLCPWRKEIRSLKTFTGNFVYYVQPALPEGVVDKLLEEIGYVATTTTEFSLVRKLSKEEAEQTAFELFLARIECENLLEAAGSVRESDLMDILQKRAQVYRHPEGHLHRRPWPSQGQQEGVATGGTRQAQEYLRSSSQVAFKEVQNAELRDKSLLTLTSEESQPAASEFTSQPNGSSLSQASVNSYFRASDSGDFLTKYSDIVIGQKRVHFTEIDPSGPEGGVQSGRLTGSPWAPPANDPPPPAPFSPDTSGPQALAILNNVPMENKIQCGYQSPGSSRKIVESTICDAMKCLNVHSSETADEPRELKWNTVQCSKFSAPYNAACGISGKETIRDAASVAFKEIRTMEDGIQKLMHPVEEIGQFEPMTSKRGLQDFDHSRMNLINQPGIDRSGFSVDLYSSELFCNINRHDHPAMHTSYDRLPGDTWAHRDVGEYFRNPDQRPIPVSPETQYCDSTQTNI